jgi:hypothetical protein
MAARLILTVEVEQDIGEVSPGMRIGGVVSEKSFSGPSKPPWMRFGVIRSFLRLYMRTFGEHWCDDFHIAFSTNSTKRL